jgi:hypothetical protein
MPQVFPFAGKDATTYFPVSGIRPTSGHPQNWAVDIAQTVRSNLAAVLRAAKEGEITGPSGVLALEAVSGIGKSTIYRILDSEGANDTSIGTLEKLAEPYGLQGWQLLAPRLDPRDPPALLSAKDREEIAIMRIVFQQVQRVSQGRGEPDIPGSGSQGDSAPGARPDSSTKPKNKKYPRGA